MSGRQTRLWSFWTLSCGTARRRICRFGPLRIGQTSPSDLLETSTPSENLLSTSAESLVDVFEQNAFSMAFGGATTPPRGDSNMASIDRREAISASDTSQPIGRPRPALLRALGRAEPPELVEADGTEFRRVTTFK